MEGKRNTAFSEEIPQLQIAWDSTSLGLLKSCPRKYYYSMIEEWQSRDSILPLTFGIYYHSALEFYDRKKAEGMEWMEALTATVRYMLELTWDKETGKPWATPCTQRNRQTLVRSVVWYIDHFKNDPAQTIILGNGKPAVELSFKFELPLVAPDGQVYICCGHMDRVVDLMGAIYVQDYKTSGYSLDRRFFNRFNPDNQVSLYTIASKIVLGIESQGVIIDGVQLLVNSNRYAREPIRRTPAQCDEWMEDLTHHIQQAERYAEAEYWPMNDTACDKYGGCAFRHVCASDPAVRDMRLKSDFIKRQWNPLEER